MSSASDPSVHAGNRGAGIIAVFWTETLVASLVIGLRLWARQRKHKTGFDDWAMLFTFVMFIGWTIIVTYLASLGGFRHLMAIPLAEASHISHMIYVGEVYGNVLYPPAKTAVAAMMLRIIPGVLSDNRGRWRKWLILVTVGAIWVYAIINCVITFTQCNPPRALWHPEIPDKNCWDPAIMSKVAYAYTALNIFADLVFAAVPATLIWGLNLTRRKRINLCILLGLGVLAAICGCIKAPYLAAMGKHNDITWEMYDAVVWVGNEIFIIMVCGSIPVLKPVWERARGKASSLRDRYTSRPTSDWDTEKSETLVSSAPPPSQIYVPPPPSKVDVPKQKPQRQDFEKIRDEVEKKAREDEVAYTV